MLRRRRGRPVPVDIEACGQRDITTMHKRATYDLAVGLALRELHKERHAMREQVGDALEVTDLGVTRIETGAETMTAGGLILLLKLFDLSWEAFMERVERHLAEAESEIL